jgi:predicted nucleotidyltransferase
MCFLSRIMINLSKKDYFSFIENFTDEVSRIPPESCFYIYGSVANGEFNPGRSDIDGVIILNSGVLTPKKEIFELSDAMSKILKKAKIKTQFNILDREICRDGRFLSYTTDYTDYFKENAKILSGPDYIKEMNGLDFKSGFLYNASFNFSGPKGVRNTLLYSLTYDDSDFKYNISKSLEKTAKFPTKLFWLASGEIIPSRKKARVELEKLFGEMNLSYIDEVNYFLDNPNRLDSLMSNRYKSVCLLKNCVESVENMITVYLKKFPQPNEREIKQ